MRCNHRRNLNRESPRQRAVLFPRAEIASQGRLAMTKYSDLLRALTIFIPILNLFPLFCAIELAIIPLSLVPPKSPIMLPEPFSVLFDNDDSAAERARLLEIVSAANGSETRDELAAYCFDTLNDLIPFHAAFILGIEMETRRVALEQTRRVPPQVAHELRALEMPPEFFAALDQLDAFALLIERVGSILNAYQFSAPLYASLRAGRMVVGLLVLAGDPHPEAQTEWKHGDARQDFLNRVGAHIGIAFQRIAAQEKTRQILEHRNRELQLLHELAARLNNTIGKQDALNAGLDLILALTRADAIGIVLIHEAEGYYDLVAHHGLEPELQQAYATAPFDRAIYQSGFDPEVTWNLIEYLILTRRTLTTEQLLAMPRFDMQPIFAMGYQSLIVFPVRFDTQVYAVVVIGSKKFEQFDDHAIELVEHISAQLGLTLHNQQVVTDLVRQVQQMETIVRTGRMLHYAPRAAEGLPRVIDQIRVTLNASYVVLHLVREDHFEIVTASDAREMRRTFPIAAYEKRLLDSEQPLIVSDSHAAHVDAEQRAILDQLNMRAVFGVRLYAQQQPLGLLFVNQDAPREWRAEDARLIHAFAQQIAYALENKRLLDEIQRQVRELEALAHAGRLISAAVFPDDALQAITKEIAQVFPADYVSFHLREGEFLHLIAESQATRAARTLPILRYQNRILEELDTVCVMDRERDAAHPRQREMLARHDIVADLGVPLVAVQKALGILYICQRRAHVWSEDEIRLAQTFAQQIASALTNARLLRESQLQVRELHVLQRSARLIAMSRSPETALPHAASELRGLLKADYVGFHLIEGDHLRALTEPNHCWANERYPIQPYHQAVLQHFQKIIVHDRGENARDATHRANLERYGAVADLGVPLVARNKALGNLFVSQYTARRWQDSEVRLIETYAQQIAGVLDNVQLLNEREARLHALAKLAEFNEIAVTLPDEQAIVEWALTAGKELIAADMISLVMVKGDQLMAARNSTNELYPLQPPPMTNLVRQVLASKEPFVMDIQHPYAFEEDARRRIEYYNIQAMLLVAIATAHENIGLLAFSYTSPHLFSTEEKQLAQTAANQLAMAFANARLLRAQSAQIENLTRHSEFSLWCGTLHDSARLQQLAVERIGAMLGAQAGSIRLVCDDSLSAGASFGYQDPAARNHKIPINAYLQRVLDQRKPYTIEDLRAAPDAPAHWIERHVREGFCALLMLPMIAENKIMGILTLFHEHARAWDEAEIQFAEALANTLALALSNTQQMETAAHKSEELQVTMDSVFSGVCTTNAEGVILSWSRRAHELTGMSEAEMVDKRWDVDGPRVGEARHADHLILEAMADNQVRFSIAPRYFRHPNGSELVLRQVVTPLRDRAGQVRGAVLAFWDRGQEQEGERAKIDFINEVAHELGNKLGAVMLAARQAQRAGISEKRRAEFVQVIADTADDIEIFHQRFTNFQHERVREEIEETEINLRAALQERIRRARAAKTGHRFRVLGDFDFVRADVHRLDVVLENLLNNAVKYAPPRSVITLRARGPSPGELVLTIHNRGPEIPLQLQLHLFERWQRGNSDKPGSGLGLWLVRTKLREMGGDISVTSSARHGTTFTITLKRHVLTLPASDAVTDNPKRSVTTEEG